MNKEAIAELESLLAAAKAARFAEHIECAASLYKLVCQNEADLLAAIQQQERLRSLLDRIRPGCEVAGWVHEEIESILKGWA